jgi:hypothetical protein
MNCGKVLRLRGHINMSLLGRRRHPSLDAFARLAAPTETRRLADLTLRPTRRRTKPMTRSSHRSASPNMEAHA